MGIIERERGKEIVEMPLEMPALDPRVERGAQLLDEKMPGWADDIDLDIFDLACGYKCVLGQVGLCQLNKNYCETVAYLFNTLKCPGLWILPEEKMYGFVCEINEDYRPVEQDWRLAIQARKTG